MGSPTLRHRLVLATLLFVALAEAAGVAAAANSASVLEASSSVPASGGANAVVTVTLRVLNDGTTTWRAGTAHRLGASASNQLPWSGYACGGYMNNIVDGRVFLCHDVAPGQTHDFRFNVQLPSSGTARLGVQMVQDGVQWFGEIQAWTLTVSAGSSLPDVVVDSVRTDPAAPQPGQSVRFVSVVRNQGNATTPSGVVIGVGYLVDGKWVTYGYSSSPLAPGASVTITTQGGAWTATSGSHSLTAHVDDVNRFPESNENNNLRSTAFSVGGGGCPTAGLSTPTDRWKLEIFNNRSLSGSPVEQRYDAPGTGGFTFNWGTGRASNCTGNDNFGVRFSRRIYISVAGTYKFTTTTDDGVRLWVDGQLLIDRWIDQAPTSESGSKSLGAGWHDLRMDYYENGGGAYAAIAWESTGGGCPTSALATPTDRWKLEIFGNRSLSGSPVEQRYDAAGTGGFTFNWGAGRASNCTGNDDFGIRFSRRIYIAAAGSYNFTTTTDDGLRLWVDGQLLIDRWIDQAPTSYSASKSLGAGWHDLRMDYYENGGGAYAAIRWEATSGGSETSLYGINIDPANPSGDPSATDVRNLGARWVRVEYKTAKGQSFYDGKIASYRNAGIKVLLIVDYSTVYGRPSTSTGTASEWSAFLQKFATEVGGLAAHYRDGVDAWQIWNEPDLRPQPGYDPYIPPNYYGVMLRDSVNAIRQYSSRPVITGGLASGDSNYLAQARNAVGTLTVDAVAVHPYGQRAPDNWPSSTWGFGNMSDLFDRYLAFGKPLWVSEIGVNTSDAGFQADYLDNVYRLARDEYRGRVQVVFWFCWSDGMVPPFGLLDGAGNPKPAYHQYRAVAPPF